MTARVVRFELNKDKTPSRIPPPISNISEYLSDLQVVRDNHGKVLLHTIPPNQPSRVEPPLNNGFVGTMYRAYNNHHELVLDPTAVWLAIMAAFAHYVDKHAEQMRKDFVEHEGKLKLEAFGGGNIYITNWPDLILHLSAAIQKNTKGDVREWMEPNFSTTTDKDRLIGRSMLMGAMKNYFEYYCCLMCGLPAVTMLGTLDDWKLLREKAEKLKEFAQGGQKDLLHWYNLLTQVLDEFVKSYLGEVDADFWSKICSSVSYGSGPSYITGWALVFTPFSKDKGEFFLNTKFDKNNNNSWAFGKCEMGKIPSTAVEVPVHVNDNGREYETLLYTGAITASYDHSTNQLRPEFDWCLIDVSDGNSNTKRE
jgi:hypothetical protein